MVEEQIKKYQSCLQSLFKMLEFLVTETSKATKSLDVPEDFEEISQNLSTRLQTISDSLASLLNWVRIQQNALTALLSLHSWSKAYSTIETKDVSEIRSRMRLMLLPELEVFIQSLFTADKSRGQILPYFEEQMRIIPKMLQSFSEFNLQLLTLIGFDPSSRVSYLDAGAQALYRGAFGEFSVNMEKIKANIEKVKKLE
ncbi:MAG: hypothetical protein ACFFC7_20660 [Candidatus Hermodarchaeota archaeon]